MGNTQATSEERNSSEYKKKVYNFLHPDEIGINKLSAYADQVCTSMTDKGENPPTGDFNNTNFNEVIYKFNMTSWGNLAYVILYCKDENYRKYVEAITNKAFKALKEERNANRIDVDNDIYIKKMKVFEDNFFIKFSYSLISKYTKYFILYSIKVLVCIFQQIKLTSTSYNTDFEDKFFYSIWLIYVPIRIFL